MYNRIPFMIGSYNGRSPQWSNSRCVNLFPESSAAGKSEIALVGSPGMTQALQIENGTAPVYFMTSNEGIFYAFNVNQCTKVTYDLATQEWGAQVATAHGATLSTIPTFCQDKVYVLTDAGMSFDMVSFNGEGGMTYGWGTTDSCQCVAYLDGYFFAVPTETRYFYLSAISNPRSWHALDYASTESDSDHLIRLYPFRGEMWMFGERKTEVWYNTGDPSFPFLRNPNVYIPVGIMNKHCIAKVGDSIMWIGITDRGQGEVYMAEGYQARKISNPIIDYHIQTFYADDYENAHCFSYQMMGHEFFVMIFPNYGTWVFDVTTGEWHEWLYWTGSQYQALKVRVYHFYQNMHLVSSRVSHTNNVIGKLDLDTYTMWEMPIKRLKISPILHDNKKLIVHDEFEADIHLGHAGTISLRYSDNGGQDWSQAKTRTVTTSDFDKRFRWRRLGASRNRIYELSTVSDMKTVWIDAYLKYRDGSSRSE
jgi:hypothetical protein